MHSFEIFAKECLRLPQMTLGNQVCNIEQGEVIGEVNKGDWYSGNRNHASSHPAQPLALVAALCDVRMG